MPLETLKDVRGKRQAYGRNNSRQGDDSSSEDNSGIKHASFANSHLNFLSLVR